MFNELASIRPRMGNVFFNQWLDLSREFTNKAFKVNYTLHHCCVFSIPYVYHGEIRTRVINEWVIR
jgi:hypothetical protein